MTGDVLDKVELIGGKVFLKVDLYEFGVILVTLK